MLITNFIIIEFLFITNMNKMKDIYYVYILSKQANQTTINVIKKKNVKMKKNKYLLKKVKKKIMKNIIKKIYQY